MRVIYIILILTINSLFSGEIVTTNDFNFIEKEAGKLDRDSILLFDVDGTLIVPIDAILKPQEIGHFNQLFTHNSERDFFREIRMKAPHILVDDRSIHLVQQLQKNNIPVIAFTAAPSKVRGINEPGIWRVDELKKYGFDFSPAFS